MITTEAMMKLQNGSDVRGVAIAGVGSAFWGVVAGALALLVAQWGRRPAGGQGGAR